MKYIASNDTTILGALSSLGYKPEFLKKCDSDNKRVEFVFKHSVRLEKDIEGIKKGEIKFSAHDLSIELHSVRSKIKNFCKI